MDNQFYPKTSTVIASVCEDGMHVEIYAANHADEWPISDDAVQIGECRANLDETINLILYVGNKSVEIPLHEFERAIEVAKTEVHSEDYYDYPEADSRT